MRTTTVVGYDDFSNMNGGYFPTHDTHQKGRHVDAQIDGYVDRDATVAEKLVQVANAIDQACAAAGGCRSNSPASAYKGFQILVDFRKVAGNPMYEVFKASTIGGKPALPYFLDGGSRHRTHFHVQMY